MHFFFESDVLWWYRCAIWIIPSSRNSSVAQISRECKKCGQIRMSNNNKQKEPEKKETNIKQWKHWITNKSNFEVLLSIDVLLLFLYTHTHTQCTWHDEFLFTNREFFRGRRLDAGVFLFFFGFCCYRLSAKSYFSFPSFGVVMKLIFYHIEPKSARVRVRVRAFKNCTNP